MSALVRIPVGLACALALALCASLLAQPPEPPSKAPDAKTPAKESTKAPAVPFKLPDGTYLWTGPSATEGERVLLTPQQYQKLLDQMEQLKKQLAARKGVAPSRCAIRGRIEKRGEISVAVLKITYAVRTTGPNVAVALGGKRGFLVAASLDGNKLPVLETVDDGFAVLIASAGEHAVALDLECPVANRLAKLEIGFELSLPKAAITTLIFEPPAGVKRLSVGTRTPEPVGIAGPAKPPEIRRVGLDAKALAEPAANRDPYPLGAVESLEVAWEPASASPQADAVQTAEIEASCLIADGFVESTAKFRPRGQARIWRIAAPADAALTVDRIPGLMRTPEPNAVGAPTISKPADANRPVWKVELPSGTSAADWQITAIVRIPRPKPMDARHKGPFTIGPFAVLDVSRQSGTVKVAAAVNSRLICKHGPDLRQEVAPLAGDDETAAYFKLATGPSGASPPTSPLLSVEVHPLAATVIVRPTYKLKLTEAGWSVRAELHIAPIRTTIDALTLDVPMGWRGLEVSSTELVEGSTQLNSTSPRQVLRLSMEHKQPFDLVLTATVASAAGVRETAVAFPRFPGAVERDTSVAATAPEGFEIRGLGHEWEGDQPAAWGQALVASAGPDGKPLKIVSAVNGKFDRGLARLDLSWSPYRPPLTADIRVEVFVRDSQIVVSERIGLHSPEPLPRTIRFHGAGWSKGLAPFDPAGPGLWSYAATGDGKEASIKCDYPIPLPRASDGAVRQATIDLVLPVGAIRTDAVVRVWMNSGTGQSVAVAEGPWRELAPEPVAERDALPALTLAASGSELPLTLEIREAGETGAASVWVERGLIQASAADDGIACRARFLLRRWLSDAVEVRLPEALGGVIPEVYLGDPPRRANASVATIGGERLLRIPLPEAKPGRGIVLDLRYRVPNRPGEQVLYAAPRPIAAFAGPIRWHITGLAGTVPLVFDGGRTEQQWRLRSALFVPLPTASDNLEKWFQSGAGVETGSGDAESVVLRLTSPDAVSVYHVSRLNLAIGCSVTLLVLGLIASRLPGAVAGPLVAVAAGAAAVAAVIYPQPAAEAAAAAEPGAAALVVILVGYAALRWYYRQRITYLPGFARTRVEEAVPSSTSGGSRSADRPPSVNGSTGSAVRALPQATSSRG